MNNFVATTRGAKLNDLLRAIVFVASFFGIASAGGWAQNLPNADLGGLPDPVNLPSLAIPPGVQPQRVGGAPSGMVLSTTVTDSQNSAAEVSGVYDASSSVEFSSGFGLLASTSRHAAAVTQPTCSMWLGPQIAFELRARGAGQPASPGAAPEPRRNGGLFVASACNAGPLSMVSGRYSANGMGPFSIEQNLIPDPLIQQGLGQAIYEGWSQGVNSASSDPASDVSDLSGGFDWFGEGLPPATLTLWRTPNTESGPSIPTPGSGYRQFGLAPRVNRTTSAVRREAPSQRRIAALRERRANYGTMPERRLHPKSAPGSETIDR